MLSAPHPIVVRRREAADAPETPLRSSFSRLLVTFWLRHELIQGANHAVSRQNHARLVSLRRQSEECWTEAETIAPDNARHYRIL